MREPIPPSRLAAIRAMAADDSRPVESRLALLDLLTEVERQSNLLAHANAELHIVGADAVDCCPGSFDPSTVRARLRGVLAEKMYRMWMSTVAGVCLSDKEFEAIRTVAQADLVRHVHVTLAATRRAKTALGLVA